MRYDGNWLPKAGPPHPRRRAGQLIRRGLTVVMCFSLGVALAAGALLWQGRHELVGTRIALNNLGAPPSESENPGGLDEATTILLVGDDSGDDLPEEYADLATGERDGQRTDTIMVLRIDPQSKKVTGINFPRDLQVPLCDGNTDKINAAWYYGGPECLIETVRDFSGVSIDHYVAVNFAGFVRTVDAVGGVTMYLEEPMEDPKAHVDLPAGCVTLDGRSALGFVRTRSDSDYGRIARQQRFMKELANEATSLSTLSNPVRLFQLVESIGGLLTMDTGLGLSTMRDIALTMRGVNSDSISLATIPTYSDNSTGVWYEHPLEQETADLLRAFRRGGLAEYLGEAEAASESPSESESDARPEPEIPLDELEPVHLLNASEVDRLAARTAEVLEAADVAVGQTGDADEPEPSEVLIRYPADLEEEAQSLQVGAFPDAALELDQTVDRVTVVLNGDFDPDVMDVAVPEVSEEPSDESSAPPHEEYANAQPVEKESDC